MHSRVALTEHAVPPRRGLELKSVEVDRVSSSSLGGGSGGGGSLSAPKYGDASPVANGGGGGAGSGAGSGKAVGAGAGAAAATTRPASGTSVGAQLALSSAPTVLAPAVFETRWEQLSTLCVSRAAVVHHVAVAKSLLPRVPQRCAA